MTMKTSAVWGYWGAVLFLAGIGGVNALAQTDPAALEMPQPVTAVESEVSAPDPAVAEPTPRMPPEQRLAELKSADLETLQAAQADCLQAAEEISTYVPELHRQMRQAYEDARQNDPAIQALKQQIADLEAHLEKLLVNHPAVLEKRQAIDQAQQDLLAELRLRTALEGRIAAQSDGTTVPPAAAPAE